MFVVFSTTTVLCKRKVPNFVDMSHGGPLKEQPVFTLVFSRSPQGKVCGFLEVGCHFGVLARGRVCVFVGDVRALTSWCDCLCAFFLCSSEESVEMCSNEVRRLLRCAGCFSVTLNTFWDLHDAHCSLGRVHFQRVAVTDTRHGLGCKRAEKEHGHCYVHGTTGALVAVVH